MQRGLIKLSTLAAAMGLVAAAHADVTVPAMKGGFNVGVDASYLQPYGIDSSYITTATTTKDADGDLIVRTGSVENDGKFKFGYGVTVGYTVPNTANDIAVSYSHYKGTADDTYNNDAATGSNVNFGSSSIEVKQDQADLLLGQYINVGSNMQLHLKGGLSYAKVNLDKATMIERADDTAQLAASSGKFSGFGPTIGVDTVYTMGNSGFGLAAGIQAAMLIGNKDFNATVATGTTDDSDAASYDKYVYNDNPSKNQVVPALAANLGLTYERGVNDAYKFGAEAGYQVKTYSNIGLQEANSSSNLTFAGPYLKLKLAAC